MNKKLFAFLLSATSPLFLVSTQAEEQQGPSNAELLKRIEKLEGQQAHVAPEAMKGASLTDMLSVDFEMRARHEYRKPETYNTGSGAIRHSDDFTQIRNRINFKADVNEDIKAMVQLQSLHLAGAKTLGGDNNDADVQQAYFTVSDFLTDDLTLTLGRKSIKYGDQRLISDLQWGSGRAWDMVGLSKKWSDDFSSDFIVSTVVDANTNLATPANATPNSDNELYLNWNKMQINPEHQVEAYFMLQHDGDHSGYQGETTVANPIAAANLGSLSRYTAGFLYKGKAADFSYSAQAAWQWGDFGSDDIDASAYALMGKYHINDKDSIAITYTLGSGDDNGSDGDNETFTAPFPFAHALYGFSDLMSWSNSEIWQITYTNKINEDLLIRVDYLEGDLETKNDSWYAAGGALRGAPGSATKIGEEIDLTLKYKYDANLSFQGGYSRFMQGEVVRETETASTRTGDQDWFYLQTLLKF